jgi:diaminohydroxyphosphoribosylaminopyrimidine deaminase / 5-amino-6-(5-phosphoribosylamino)uracil reductase
MENHPADFMQRCFDLARLGAGSTTPNPMVGAVLVHEGRIIGEGYHQAYGQAHAEVNAVRSVAPADRGLLPYATLYVSLEPCSIYGKTPPCTELILKHRIPRVVLACLDQTAGVNGAGVQRLRAAGVQVEVGLLRAAGERLSSIRNTFVAQQRPYVLLKYAQSANGCFAPAEARQLWLTNAFSRRLAHKWRSEVDAILVGPNTARIDNPQLDNRLYFGRSPCRVTFDRAGTLPLSLALFDGRSPTLLFGAGPPPSLLPSGVEYVEISFGPNWLDDFLKHLAARRLTSLMVEGGLQTLQLFLDAGWWDEARVLTAATHLPLGRPAPQLPVAPESSLQLGSDQLHRYFNPRPRQALNFI